MPAARLTAVVAAGFGDLESADSVARDWDGWRVALVESTTLERHPAGSAKLFESGWRAHAADTDAVLFLEAGDLVLPGYAARLTPLFGPGVGAVYPDHRVGPRRAFCEPCGAGRFERPWAPRAALVAVAALRAVGGFDPRLGPAAAFDFWLRLAERFAVYHVPEALAALPAAPAHDPQAWAAALAAAKERAGG